ncbi:endo-1,4-beta-xylanase [Sphingobium sp.]|uniref:endo-1,4-beta-xylanase n=1 Tax=Sphingobium sp. TaxID=1912891 RepID=UPI003BB7F8CA
MSFDLNLNRRQLIGGAAAAGLMPFPALAADSCAPAATFDYTPGTARRIASSKGLFFGSCIGVDALRKDARYRAINAQECNLFVHASELMWHELQPLPNDPYDFSRAEDVYAFGKHFGTPFRGHMMLDWNGLPKGFYDRVASLSRQDTESLLVDHVQRLATHWKGRFLDWNVMNEPVCGTVCPKNPWFPKLGEEYIDLAFATTRSADDKVRLNLNQNLIEMEMSYERKTRDALFLLVERLRKRGVDISSVGIEGHIRNGRVDQAGLEKFILDLRSIGLTFFLSEIDVDDRDLPECPTQRDIAAASLVRDLLDVALAQPTCLGIIFWDLTDRYNWLVHNPKWNRANGGKQRPTLFDIEFRPKAMLETTVAALKAAVGPGKLSIMPA